MGFSDRGYYRFDNSYRSGSDWTAVITLIIANVAVWVLNLLSNYRLNSFLEVDSELPQHLWNAWKLISYGFAHARDPLHIFGNMLGLFFFGRAVEQVLGRAEFYRFYLSSIAIAGLAWVVSVNLYSSPEQMPGLPPPTPTLIGASGGVMAVLAVFIWYFPRQEVLIWGILPMPAWVMGLILAFFDISGAVTRSGNVAHVAHIGGAVFGLLYAWRGWSLTGLADVGSRLRQMRRRFKVVRPEDDFGRGRPDDEDEVSLQAKVDDILEKISRSGESSLTADERDTLTRASRRFKGRSR